jgi:signal peptidase I
MAHLKLFRDLYYTQIASREATGTMNNPVTLHDDEFFALGDNSRRSLDGRLWGTVHAPLSDLALGAGIVPRRYLLGKAFFVYWPAGFTPVDPMSRIPFLRDIPLVPNTGEVRIIR